MTVVAFDARLRIEPQFSLQEVHTRDDLIADLHQTTQCVAKIGTETKALLERIAALEALVTDPLTKQAITAVTDQARTVQATLSDPSLPWNTR